MEETELQDHENAELILSKGWALFQQKGFRGVTIDELCLQCGLSKPTLYYYFQDKENLFVQVLRHKLQGFHQVMEKAGTLPERLQWMAASILESFQTEYSVLLHDREHIKDAENLKRIRDAFHGEMFGPLINLMKSGIESGELDGDSPEMLALMFLGIINNFIGKAGEMGVDNLALAHTLTNYFLKGANKK
jgi:AcrR family transcriptional regulator